MVVAVSARSTGAGAGAAAADRGRGIEMRAKDMHPLCCINIDCPGLGGGGGGVASSSSSAGGRSPAQQQADHHGWDRGARREPPGNAGACPRSEVPVAGILYKWTNYGRGWRSRWFSLTGGVLYYSKTRVMPEGGGDGRGDPGAADVRLIGNRSSTAAGNGVYRVDSGHGGGSGGRRKPRKPDGVVQLKVSSFRESRSDDRRFYIFSTTKTLHLKTDSKKDRADWIEALKLARNSFPLRSRSLTDRLPFVPNEVSFSTEKLRNRLLEEGLSEVLIKDCEHIMLSEFMNLRLVYEENLGLLALRQCEESADVRTTGLPVDQMLIKDGFSGSGHGKFSEYSTTESSDDIGKQDLDELSEEDDEAFYFDSRDTFSESGLEDVDRADSAGDKVTSTRHKFPHVERRMKLPDPVEKEKGVSLWSMIKDNVGKDLTRVCLPVYFNEPLSSLQKCFEDLEYSYLLDRAYEYGKMGNSIMRTLYVAAFAVSGYASTVGRPCKPFNPLLGETYEADYPEKGVRFFSEKVSHHPMVIACHCEGRGWKFWGDSNLKSKFWGRSIQVDPIGILTLEFDDGEIFQWSKVTTTIYNLILGKIYCNHHGMMHIQGNRSYSCKLKFKEQTLLDRNPHQVQGFVEDIMGTKVASLTGKWDESLFYAEGDDISKIKSANLLEAASLLWKKSDPAPNPTRYNLTSFAITLNELTPELQEKLPPTDSRRRPDQRHLENGEYEKANAEKQRLERRQRMSRSLQERGWKPRWFHRDGEDGTFRYIGGYWEAREQKKWDGCLHIFGEISEESNGSSFK